MNGITHVFVANMALASLGEKERHILYPRWSGIESGSTLSDHFRVMWEIEMPGDQERQLVHRCYVDSDNKKDHGCVTRAYDYSKGSLSFIRDFMNGELEGVYSEDSFLENLGMFLGVASHHIADLCTSVHVGHKIDFNSLGFKSYSKLHARVERDICRLARRVPIRLSEPIDIELSKRYFWEIAVVSYNKTFLKLYDTYHHKDEDLLRDVVSEAISSAVIHTASVWHTVLKKSGMLERKWSMQPLL